MTVELVRSSAPRFRRAVRRPRVDAGRADPRAEQARRQETEADTARDRGLINYLMRDRHGSPFEHNSMTFYVQAPIFVFREFMRHRIASYNEECGPLPRAAAGLLRARRERRLVQIGKPGAYEFIAGLRRAVRARRAATRDGVAPRVRGVPADARGRRRARGRADRAAAEHLLVDVRDDERALADELPVAAHEASRTSHFPSFPQREIEMCAEQMEDVWARLMPLTHAAFEANGRVAP